MRKTKSILNPNAVRIKQDPEGSGSGSLEDIISQESSVSARRFKEKLKEKLRMRSSVGGIIASASTSETSTSISQTSLTHSIDKFREDFDDFKCKMKIFGESLNLCKCIASDFKGKLSWMERRLQNLEKRQKLIRNESNYPAIIKKNKELSKKTLVDANKLKMCGTEEEMREVAGRICRNYLHGAWKTVDAKDLEFKKIVGGLSNFLYYVALPEDASKMNFMRTAREDDDKSNSFTLEEPKKVLLRIYGQVHGERAMDAIVTESVIFTLLSERRLGPKLYGVFSGGRIEEYIPARALLTKELSDPALSMKIAEKMAAIHSMDIPLSKEPNWLWKTMGKWLKTVKEERLGAATTKGKTEIEQQIIRRLKLIDYEKEIEWLKKLVASVESPVVFCHNDMQEGNILLLEDHVQNTNDDYVAPYDPNYDQTLIDKHIEEQSKLSLDEKEQNPNSSMIFMDSMSQFDDANTSDSHISDNGEPKLYIIDFEYCAYNYRGFDIANHFQEWAFDYTNPQHPYYYEIHENLPTLEQKEIFIKEYLKHYQTFLSDEKEPQASIEAVNKLLGEVEAFALVSHLFWSLWSVVNASKSQITFGYWEYALSRIESYLLLKQEYVKGNSSRNGQKRKICEVDI